MSTQAAPDLDPRVATAPSHQPALSVGLAISATEIESAQRLRYRVFGEELGARLNCATPGVDEDIYDPFCRHLVVRDNGRGAVVGTYRILPPENAAMIGRYYTESEFDIHRLSHLRPTLVEVGRACVHPDYRSGATIALLWSGLMRFMLWNGHSHLLGCCAISMADGGHAAASLYARLQEYMSPTEYRAFPHCPLPIAALRRNVPARVPPLLKGYLRAGASICGAPAWDPDFNTADLPLLLPMANIAARYARHFVRRNA
jgi:putative hemolysin